MGQPLLTVKDLKKHFPIRSGLLMRQTGTVYALDGVSFTLNEGESLGLVGESGCGKSTLGRTVIRIYRSSEGEITFGDKNVADLRGNELHDFRRNVQMIFQDPYSSLNPRRTVGNIIDQPMKVHKIPAQEREARVSELLNRVGLGDWAKNRYPHEFSGGQRQRIAIARAIALRPKLVIADEPVSALDVSVQSQILNLMQELRNDLGISYLFIAHDLAVVKHMADRVAVMYLGAIAELADKQSLYKTPTHPYTQALLAANPTFGKGKREGRPVLQGDVPSPVNPPSGCRFHPRCPHATDICKKDRPALKDIGTSDSPHLVSCHHVKSKIDYPTLGGLN